MAKAPKYEDLGLTIDQVIARYLRQIADGPRCVETLRANGYQKWRDAWWCVHGMDTHAVEWDSRNYDDSQMRENYDGIIEHASRTEQA